MANDYSSTVSGILAQALVTLPRIIMTDLYVKCEGQIGTVGLAQFRLDVGKWLSDGTIPGYEARLGRTGGIYRAGSPNERTATQIASDDLPKLDPVAIASVIEDHLKTHPRITVGDLAAMIDYSPMTEIQFRSQISAWLNDGKTFTQFESHKGKMGGIYTAGQEVEKWVPISSSDSDDDESESSDGSFTLQISPTLQIVQSNERNWTIQKKSGDNWLTQYYHPSLDSALSSVSKHIINGEFKMASSTAIQLKDLASMIQQMESRLTDKLKDVAKA